LINKAVVLAAGQGSRLRSRPPEMPKGLVPLLGRPLIDYTLDALRACGVQEVAVVLGHGNSFLREHMLNGGGLGLRVHLPVNAEFAAGASTSLACARSFAGSDPFLLTMADHLLTSGLVARLAAEDTDCSAMAVDRSEWPAAYVAESTKVVTERGLILDCGKRVEAWDGLDTGAFLCTSEIWQALDALPPGVELNDLFRWLARRGRLRVCDVTGFFWYDVDTDDDLAQAARRLPLYA
jgi:choline kinase